VFGLNDDGVVVGVFTDKNGTLHGFKATPKPQESQVEGEKEEF
jgi:probable HAF family extracellular repeat protein